MIPIASDLQSMGYTFQGQPFVEIDGQPLLTSPGYMGVTWDGQPVTFAPTVLLRRMNTSLQAGGMGIKKPHRP